MVIFNSYVKLPEGINDLWEYSGRYLNVHAKFSAMKNLDFCDGRLAKAPKRPQIWPSMKATPKVGNLE